MRSITRLSGLVVASAVLVGCSVAGPAASTPSASTMTLPPAGARPPPGVTPSTPAPAAVSASGIAGRTMVDGGCPVYFDETPCPPQPMSARIIVRVAGAGRTIADVVSDADGRFRLEVPPGGYVLQAVNLTGGPFPRSAPVDVTVRSGSYTTVTVTFDSGIQRPAGSG